MESLSSTCRQQAAHDEGMCEAVGCGVSVPLD